MMELYACGRGIRDGRVYKSAPGSLPLQIDSFLLSHIVYIEKKPVEVEVLSGESFGLW